MTTKLTWYGHATLGLETGGYKILIDPFFTGNPAASACTPCSGRVGRSPIALDAAGESGAPSAASPAVCGMDRG